MSMSGSPGGSASRVRSLFDDLIAVRDHQRQVVASAPTVIKGKDLPFEVNPIGRMRWYLHPSLETAIKALMIATHELRPGEATGRVRCQGGSVIFYISGRGRTVLDGAVYDWKADDCVNVPIRPDGVIIQHFNTGDGVATFVEAAPNLVHALGVDRGAVFEVLEAASAYRAESDGAH